MNLLRNPDDEVVFCKAVAQQTGRSLEEVRASWSPPAQYPCMVSCQVVGRPGEKPKMLTLYVYPQDCIALLQAAGYRVFFDPASVSRNAVPLPNLLEYHRQSSALLMAVIDELQRVGIVTDMDKFQTNLAQKLTMVDRFSSEMVHGEFPAQPGDLAQLVVRTLYPQ